MVCSHGEAPCSSALLCVLLLVLIVTMTTGHVEITQIEPECLREGGICVAKDSCSGEWRVNKTGLCPQQEAKGAVCCNQVPDSEPACRQHGGRCGQQAECQNVQSFGQLDCDEGFQCCLLIF